VRGQELNLIPIADASDPRIADFANLKDRELESRRAAFIAEGELVVRRLIGSAFGVRSVLLAEGWVAKMEDSLRVLAPGTPVFVGTPGLVNQIVGFPMHRGVLAAGDRGSPSRAEELLRSCSSLVVLEDIANLDNLGGVFRNAAALGGPAPGVLLSPGCCDPLYRKSIRVSMGWALRVPFARLEPWPDGLAAVAGDGFTTIAMTPGKGSIDLSILAARGVAKPALVLGTEGPGLTEGCMNACAVRGRVGMKAGMDSLNVVVAGAIAMSRLVESAATPGH